MAFQGKDEDARAVIDTNMDYYMDYCAKRWQTREAHISSNGDDSCLM